MGIIAYACCLKKFLNAFSSDIFWRKDFIIQYKIPFWLITFSSNLYYLFISPKPCNTHLVCGKRACFIRTYDCCRTKRLHSREFFHNRPFLCHPLHTHGKREADCGKKPCWHICNDNAYC